MSSPCSPSRQARAPSAELRSQEPALQSPGGGEGAQWVATAPPRPHRWRRPISPSRFRGPVLQPSPFHHVPPSFLPPLHPVPPSFLPVPSPVAPTLPLLSSPCSLRPLCPFGYVLNLGPCLHQVEPTEQARLLLVYSLPFKPNAFSQIPCPRITCPLTRNRAVLLPTRASFLPFPSFLPPLWPAQPPSPPADQGPVRGPLAHSHSDTQ